MDMDLEITQVDAFTSRPFTGNPAAVCLLQEPPPPDWRLQDIAREMNLSETAFLMRQEDGFDLRWFTPAVEVELCGHATLASAHMLWEEGHLEAGEEARFHTRSGLLTARRDDDWIELDFPLIPSEPIDCPDGLVRGLGIDPVAVFKGTTDLLVLVDDEKVVRTLHPNFAALGMIDARGIVVTSEAIVDRFDFVSRFFAPRAGINEDPVTGSAHCMLAPFWSKRLGLEKMIGYQVSDRGGMVRVEVKGDRVLLGGQAVTVMKGVIVV